MAEKRGGAIFAESFLDLDINSFSTFYNNEALTANGDVIFAQNSLKTLGVHEVTMESSQASNFIYASEVQSI